MRARSASPNGRERYDNRYYTSKDYTPGARTKDVAMSDAPGPENRDDPTLNPGSNLFVTGIAPRLSEEEVSRLFQEFGDVVNCNIMRDPHSGESRGFGFVKMATAEAADAAREGLSGKAIENRTLSIEKARRGRPRTPTPGKYYGPPKRGMCSLAVSTLCIQLTRAS
jgi:transformer-2 protein